MTAPRYPKGGYTGLGAFGRRRQPSVRAMIVAAGVLALIAVLALVAALYFNSRASRIAGDPHGAVAASARNMNAYDEGTCLYEVPGDRKENITLQRTECVGDRAVFVVNHVVGKELDCARFADYADYGLIQTDNSAGVVYCLSLIMSRGDCVHLAGGSAPQRTECGAVADARRVERIVPSSSPGKACDGMPGADPWYWRSPEEHRVACLLPV